MAKYIELEAAIQSAKEPTIYDLTDVPEWLSSLPTADVVPVVRCKDCRWSRTNQKDDADVYYCELRTGRVYHSGDFCSYGERRGDG